jgi:hypothetical protein
VLVDSGEYVVRGEDCNGCNGVLLMIGEDNNCDRFVNVCWRFKFVLSYSDSHLGFQISWYIAVSQQSKKIIRGFNWLEFLRFGNDMELRSLAICVVSSSEIIPFAVLDERNAILFMPIIVERAG